MYRIILLFLTCVVVFAMSDFASAQIRFNPDGKLKIVQFTDIHWTPSDPASVEAEERMNEILDAERPDLVIFTGDLVYGSPAREALINAVNPTIRRGVPFAVTWGNHDDEYDASRKELFDIISKLPGNLSDTVAGLSGVTNFVISVMGCCSDSTSAVIYVMDSNGYSDVENAKGYAGLQPDQINWYAQQSHKFTEQNAGKPLPALAFFHIPLNEINLAVSDESALLMGTRRERACTPSLNSGMFAQMLKSGDVMATFTGHDHINDYAVMHKGILLCYGRYSGGRTVYCDIPGGNGARIIELTEGKRGFRSWIRLACNRIIGEFEYPHDFTRWKMTPNE